MALWQSQKWTTHISWRPQCPWLLISLDPLPHSHRALASSRMFPVNDYTSSLSWDETPPADNFSSRTLYQPVPSFCNCAAIWDFFYSICLPSSPSFIDVRLHDDLKPFPAIRVSSTLSFIDVPFNKYPASIISFSVSASQRICANTGLFCFIKEQALSEGLPCAMLCANCLISISFNFQNNSVRCICIIIPSL